MLSYPLASGVHRPFVHGPYLYRHQIYIPAGAFIKGENKKMNWLRSNQKVVFLLVSAALIAGISDGLSHQVGRESFSLSLFLALLFNTLTVQALLIGLLLLVGSKWPRLSGALLLLLALGGLLALPSYLNESGDPYVIYPAFTVAFLAVIGLYFASAVLLIKKRNPLPR